MHSTLWGPPLWEMMFACAWNVSAATHGLLNALLLHELPHLLPCETCRNNYERHEKVVKKLHKRPLRTVDDFVLWCWYLKDEVNKTTKQVSIPLNEVVERLLLHGPHVSEVRLADVLVLMALSARGTNRDNLFISFCHNLSQVLPLPKDSALRATLAIVERPICNSALRCARRTRIQHGVDTLVMAHYKAMAS